MTQVILTYKYQLLLSKRQHRALANICEAQRVLYNAALAERIDCYRKTGKSLSYISQAMSLRAIRADDPDGYGAVPANLSRATLQRLHHAFDGFFLRVKSGGKAGFPRFKSRDRWRSFGFAEFSGIRFDGKRLRFKGMPSGLRVHLHRPMPSGKPLSCQFIRDHKGWSVAFQVNAEAVEQCTVSRAVGIDVGLNTLAYLSDGVVIPNPRVARRAQRELRRRSRALSRCRRGSSRRRKIKARLTALHCRIANSRRTYLHQQSAMMIVRKGLADRVHSCPDCGLILDRDHNAALNILRLGVLAQGIGNVAQLSGERRSGNLKLKGISN